MSSRSNEGTELNVQTRRRSATIPRLSEPTQVPQIEIVVEVEAGKPAPRTQMLEAEIFRIGSHPSNDLILRDPTVSRFHCTLRREESGWRVVDNGSLNGTRVGGITTRDADLVRPECRLTLGDSVIVVRELGLRPAPPIPGSMSFGSLIGGAQSMRKIYGVIERVARTDTTVLIEGESGTGKELLTAEIVRRSARSGKPFVVVDCGSIAPTLVESELFGHARGAFTGAARHREGVFEAADGGTVFLDEIGELPLEMQPKLLRVLQTSQLRRVGENQHRQVDVRIIAATNRALEREVNQGRFREDLYFRLSVVTIRVPPLRDRIEDIPLLLDSFLTEWGAEDKHHLFTPEVMDAMMRHSWPGNIRELRNFIERRVVFEVSGLSLDGDDVTAAAVLPRGAPEAEDEVDLEKPFRVAKEEMITSFERRYLTALLKWSGGNVSLAARKAQVDRMHLHRLLQNHGLRKSGSLGD
ncbi:MAG: sigma 54-interacting transcriptional regulator [Polyangiaceae bacterium]